MQPTSTGCRRDLKTGTLFLSLFLDQMAQLALHRLERVVDHFVERLVRTVIHLLFVAHQFMPWPNSNVDPTTVRISFLMGMVCLLDRDVAAVDVIAKLVEPRGISHYQIVDLV